MPAILITGSEGLIGKSLSEHLQDKNYSIIKFDRKLHQDINHPDHVSTHIEQCHGIIHLAAISRVVWGEKDPDLCWQTNVEGTKNILKAALSSSHKPWIIYASSREVYGQQEIFPVKESALLQPLNIYARSKVAAENLVTEYQSYGLNTAILRFSSVYGSTDDHPDRVMPAFCKAAALGQTLRIEGLDNILDFTHLSDVVEAIIKTVYKLEQKEKLPIMHITTGQPTSLLQAAKLACQFSQQKSTLIKSPKRNYDVSQFYGDPTLAQNVLDWSPKINIIHGIAQMVKAFYENSQDYSRLPATL